MPFILALDYSLVSPKFKRHVFTVKYSTQNGKCISKNNAKIKKTNIQDHTGCFKTNLARESKLE